MSVRAVVFDVGETLVDETRVWCDWADAIGVSRLTFLTALGAIVARGGSHLDVFQRFRPGLDVHAMRLQRLAAGYQEWRLPDDLYPDAVDAIEAVRAAGYRVGIAGNQPSSADVALAALDLDLDLLGSSATWGVEKPDAAFFQKMTHALGLRPHEIAYVGDRLDNDVRPAARAGMMAVWIRRGPWTFIREDEGVPPEADLVIDALTELPEALRRARPASAD